VLPQDEEARVDAANTVYAAQLVDGAAQFGGGVETNASAHDQSTGNRKTSRRGNGKHKLKSTYCMDSMGSAKPNPSPTPDAVFKHRDYLSECS